MCCMAGKPGFRRHAGVTGVDTPRVKQLHALLVGDALAAGFPSALRDAPHTPGPARVLLYYRR
jgi:hypothetical protein